MRAPGTPGSKEHGVRAIALSLGGVMLIAGGAWAVLAQPACQRQNCDPLPEKWHDLGGFTPEQAAFVKREMPHAGWVSDTIWQSGPIEEDWLDFDAQTRYTFRIYGTDQLPDEIIPYVSSDPKPDSQDAGEASQWTIGSGNLAEFWSLHVDRPDGGAPSVYFDILNNTCAHYYLRVVFRGHHNLVGAPPADVDAGDASIGDASDAGDASGNAVDAADASSNTVDAADASGNTVDAADAGITDAADSG